MPVKVACDECGAKFSIGDRQLSAPCPKCGTPKRKPKADAGGKPSVQCPSCKKKLPAGVTFCAACGVNVGATDAGDAAVAGWGLEQKSQRDIARWHFFSALGGIFRRWW
ncbi:MAG: hypothetical protein SFV23_05225 [Planctomycetaceae bacterium]|nr:hypothetical protein [Planctomycetaceae bacterium]